MTLEQNQQILINPARDTPPLTKGKQNYSKPYVRDEISL